MTHAQLVPAATELNALRTDSQAASPDLNLQSSASNVNFGHGEAV